jgi:hypothetical protein
MDAIVGALIERGAVATHEAVRRALVEHARAPLPTAVRALLDALVDTPSAPALHRELVEHVDVARRRQLVHELRSRIAAQFAELLVRRRAELRPLADRDATMFVLQHAIEAATHAAAFYRPDGLSIERTLDALTELVTRALLPVADRPAAPARAR